MKKGEAGATEVQRGEGEDGRGGQRKRKKK